MRLLTDGDLLDEARVRMNLINRKRLGAAGCLLNEL